ncbi:hypothetical protein HELRODRAFT_68939, partial [Helobdella robusta]|uniref:Chloride channel protein n=1 Tax=Helobdella robusta TaxID=6412 RepID=T1FZM2_HELRO
GSGIPEIKTILTGVSLKQYLNFSTLVSKVVGLTFSLGSVMPLGKLGPFVHVGSATAWCLSKFFPAIQKVCIKMESAYSHVLTAGAAVGVSCIFATPIGGIMYSIEATATNYATKNFWRCLYGAMVGAISFRLMTTWARSELATIVPFFKSDLNHSNAYDELEILIFIALGVICGLLGALFVFSHQSVVLFVRRRKKLSAWLQKTRFVYPGVVTLVIFTVLFPAGLGQYMAGQVGFEQSVIHMFDNRTWTSAEAHNEEELRYLEVWRGPLNNPILTVFLYFIMRATTTLPVPCGIFIPAFTLGAAFGRLSGEVMAYYFPGGIRGNAISPGAYSIICAAALSGAMSHTVSPSVIAFEMTGYLGHILPCVISVCVAGAVANFLRPSVYDAIIKIKNLPFLAPVINPQETKFVKFFFNFSLSRTKVINNSNQENNDNKANVFRKRLRGDG